VSETIPTNITANRQTRILTITWNDGHISHYPFAFLRRACPCATCKGGHENMGAPPPAEIYMLPDENTPATRLTNIEAVGSYAISLQWEDGHQYGIYNWKYLRAICPCEACRPD